MSVPKYKVGWVLDLGQSAIQINRSDYKNFQNPYIAPNTQCPFIEKEPTSTCVYKYMYIFFWDSFISSQTKLDTAQHKRKYLVEESTP